MSSIDIRFNKNVTIANNEHRTKHEHAQYKIQELQPSTKHSVTSFCSKSSNMALIYFK